MDICVLNPFFYPYSGGTEKVLYEVYSRLAKKHNVTVISASLNSKQKKHSVDYVNGIKIVRLRTRYLDIPKLPMPMPIMWGLKDVLAETDAEVYHINNRYLYYFDTVGKIKKTNKKIALTLHDAVPKNIDTITNNGGYLYEMLWGRRIMQYADLITAVSRNTLESTVPKAYRRSKRTRVIYNGVDYSRYTPRKADAAVKELKDTIGLSDSLNILNNGRLVVQKGQIYLLGAVAELIKEHRDLNIMLLIIGKGYLKDTLKYMAKNIGIDKQFKIVSGIKEEVLPFYYNCADLFVSASLYEPASIAVMEAMSSRIPIVATRVGGVPEMLKDSGFYAKPGDVDSIKKKTYQLIDTIINDRKKVDRITKKSRNIIIREHNWDKIAKEYEKEFGGLLKY